MPEERREQVTRVVIEQSQRLTGGTRRSRWKAAAFNGWHEPDKSRGLCPESVSGSGCKPPGRLGLGVQFLGPTLLIRTDEYVRIGGAPCPIPSPPSNSNVPRSCRRFSISVTFAVAPSPPSSAVVENLIAIVISPASRATVRTSA